MNYKEERQWGTFEILIDDTNYKVKRIVVYPKQRLSLQSHEKRNEHWIVVVGEVKITNGENVREYSNNDYIYIPVGNKHRIENIGEENAEIIEIQTGEYFGEDDIIRYEDDYNRIKGK
ncbi:MAG: phosphomannose isomerase type II C-terminal cupin domain [Candidatus Marinimicrobia bacterium]|nr:phosphomannose isomerase type II C-terminal cupin domain [Candidatus Neomarinimicrobiota bacterium]